eukprot:scaffold22639_cov105-Cylindrotheca_fusiformis.AAC.5
MMNAIANNDLFMPMENMYYPVDQQEESQQQHTTTHAYALDLLNGPNSRTSFPEKLHGLIMDAETMGFQDVVSWQDSGKSFKVHKPQIFQNDIIPKYFKPIKYTSFQRQRIRTGWNTGGYEHPCFLRESPALCKNVRRHQKPSAISQVVAPVPAHTQTLRHQPMTSAAATTLALSEEEFFHLNSDFDPFEVTIPGTNATTTQSSSSNSGTETHQSSPEDHHDFEPLPIGSTLIPKVSSHGDLLSMEDDQFILDKLKNCFEEEMEGVAGGIIQHPLKQIEQPVEQKQDNSKSAFFPAKLHQLLEDAERLNFAHIVSWTEDGRAFQIHDQKEFVSNIMNIYFDQSKFASFRRQLNLYGFNRTRTNNNRNMYFHESFLQGHPKLCEKMYRRCASGTKPAASFST